MECNLYMQQYVESNQRKQKEIEKSMAAMKKEMAEMKSVFGKKNKEMEKELKELKATLRVEKEVSEATNDALENVKKENRELTEQIESIALESMMKERSDLMKDFLEGKTAAWEPEKWITEYDQLVAGLSSSDEGDVEGKEKEVESGEEELIGAEEVDVAEDKGKSEEAGRMEVGTAAQAEDRGK